MKWKIENLKAARIKNKGELEIKLLKIEELLNKKKIIL